jgi:dolichol-phosphate mannosyltransferase
VASRGYCFQVDLTRRALHRGFTVAEVPITFVDRTAGASKMSMWVLLEALWRVTQWALITGTAQEPPSGPHTSGTLARG